MTKLQPVRGTHDILPEDHRKFRHVVETARAWAERFSFAQMDTPIFEYSDVFHRTLGDTSDVVTKETYTFEDRGGESITLRPEFTASIARAFLSNGLRDQLPLKWFYAGPAFRYERPQKGRFRQFHQIGAELLGIEHYIADVEIIELAHSILNALGLNATLHINTLGDGESRAAYRDALVQYFTAHREQLSEESKLRLERNPLRILDSKDVGDRSLIINAPRFEDSLTAAAKTRHANVLAGLAARGIPYTQDDRLVRGLDYYSHTVFEFTSDALGAQNTVLAGGRYDNLIETMAGGGQSVAGVGFAAGVERLLALVEFDSLAGFKAMPRPIALTPLGDEFNLSEICEVATDLRARGHAVELLYKGNNLGKRMKHANNIHAAAVIIFGEEEMKNGNVKLKHMDSGEESLVALAALSAALECYR